MGVVKGETPLYRQAAVILRQRIHNREFQVQIPPENVLTREFKVSHFTLRQALEVLKNEGLIHGKQGGGTLLTKANQSKYGLTAGALEDLVYYASESPVKILQEEIIPAPEEEAEKLRISPQEKIFRYTTLWYFQKHPFSFSRVHYDVKKLEYTIRIRRQGNPEYRRYGE